MAERSDKRVVETTIAAWIPADLSGAELGEKVIEAIDRFAFRDIEDPAKAEDLFGFVKSQEEREHLASTYRGTRWQQKIGLMFARPADHDAHHAQVRAQLIGYGAIAEAALRIMLQQNGSDAPPNDFDGIITKARAAGILSKDAAESAHKLRLYRNRVHLFLDSGAKSLVAQRDAHRAFTALVTVLQSCRKRAGLSEWKFGSEPAESEDG